MHVQDAHRQDQSYEILVHVITSILYITLFVFYSNLKSENIIVCFCKIKTYSTSTRYFTKESYLYQIVLKLHARFNVAKLPLQVCAIERKPAVHTQHTCTASAVFQAQLQKEIKSNNKTLQTTIYSHRKYLLHHLSHLCFQEKKLS